MLWEFRDGVWMLTRVISYDIATVAPCNSADFRK